jgi:hypothetical protein
LRFSNIQVAINKWWLFRSLKELFKNLMRKSLKFYTHLRVLIGNGNKNLAESKMNRNKCKSCSQKDQVHNRFEIDYQILISLTWEEILCVEHELEKIYLMFLINKLGLLFKLLRLRKHLHGFDHAEVLLKNSCTTSWLFSKVNEKNILIVNNSIIFGPWSSHLKLKILIIMLFLYRHLFRYTTQCKYGNLFNVNEV